MDTNVANDVLDCYGFPKRICDMCGYGTPKRRKSRFLYTIDFAEPAVTTRGYSRLTYPT